MYLTMEVEQKPRARRSHRERRARPPSLLPLDFRVAQRPSALRMSEWPCTEARRVLAARRCDRHHHAARTGLAAIPSAGR